jgi:hypothetical protein
MISSQETASPEEPPSGRKEAKHPGQKYVQYLDSTAKALVRVVDGKIIAKAVMIPGPTGFAQGVFPGEAEEFETDMPNLYLLPPVIKKKPAAGIRKKPAGRKGAVPPEEALDECVPEEHEEPENEEANEEEGGLEEVFAPAQEEHLLEEPVTKKVVLKYPKMFYKASGAWAIRQNFCAKKQVFQIKNKNKTKEQLENVVDIAISKLMAGMSEQAAKSWAQAAACELE